MLTDPEHAAILKEYHELRQIEEFEKSTGLSAVDRTVDKSALDAIWPQEKTADALGISQSTVSQAIKIAKAVEENPELASLIKQFDDMMREKFGSSEKGGFGGGAVVKDMEGRLLESNNRDGWTTTKTADALGISQSIMLHMQ